MGNKPGGVRKGYRRLRRLLVLGSVGAAVFAWRQKQIAENARRHGEAPRSDDLG